jgi:four helix bundle protein
MTSDELKNRTKIFAHRSVKLALSLPNNTLGNHIKNQLIRCGTSVGSNYRATCLAQSKAAFISKMSIVTEETDEVDFWIEFINDENLMSPSKTDSLKKEAQELLAIFCKSRLTARKNQ